MAAKNHLHLVPKPPPPAPGPLKPRPYRNHLDAFEHRGGPEFEAAVDLMFRLHDRECELDLLRRRWKMCMDENGKRELAEQGELVKIQIETLKHLQAKAA